MTELAAYTRTKRILVAAGHHVTTPWWQTEFSAFYASGAREWILRVGRGGRKSCSATEFAVVEVLAGKWKVPPGERHYFAFVSVRQAEAEQRLFLIESFLRALRVPFKRSGETIDLEGPLGFKVFVADVGSVSGFRCIGWVADEVAKWTSSATSANPAEEVITSLRAMTVTHPNARGMMISSPLGFSDYHALTFDAGANERQYVSPAAASWIANPDAISEDATHRLEPDARRHAREYAAIPQAGRLGAFDVEAIDRAFREAPENLVRGPRTIIVDPSSGRKDTWSWAVCGWDSLPSLTGEAAAEVLRFELFDGVRESFWRTLSGADVVARVAAVAHAYGVTEVHADQRESLMLTSEFHRAGLTYRVHDWTSASKPKAVETVRRLFAESRIILPEHPELRSELLSFEERITPSGAITFAARGSGHDDFVALLITAAMAELQSASWNPFDPENEARWAEAITECGWGGRA